MREEFFHAFFCCRDFFPNNGINVCDVRIMNDSHSGRRVRYGFPVSRLLYVGDFNEWFSRTWILDLTAKKINLAASTKIFRKNWASKKMCPWGRNKIK